MGDAKNDDLRVSFDSRLKLKFCGSKVTSDAGLLAYRELDETLGLTQMGSDLLTDSRQGSNKAHAVTIGNIPSLKWFQAIPNGKSRLNCEALRAWIGSWLNPIGKCRIIQHPRADERVTGADRRRHDRRTQGSEPIRLSSRRASRALNHRQDLFTGDSP